MSKRYYPRDFNNKTKDGKNACVFGMQNWCKIHKIDFRDFAKNGLTAEQIRSTNDAYAIKLLEKIESNN